MNGDFAFPLFIEIAIGIAIAIEFFENPTLIAIAGCLDCHFEVYIHLRPHLEKTTPAKSLS